MSCECPRSASAVPWWLLVLPVLLGGACRWSAERRLRLHADVAAYYAVMRKWTAADAEASRTVRQIMATQFMDEARVLELIRDYRPHLEAHLKETAAYQPVTSEVRRVHARYRKAWKTLDRALRAVERGFTSGDYRQLAAGRRGMAAWREGLVEVASELRRLMATAGVSTVARTDSAGRGGARP